MSSWEHFYKWLQEKLQSSDENEESIMSACGCVWGTAIVVGTMCGILEMFSIDTGIVAIISAIIVSIPFLLLFVYILCLICRKIIQWAEPGLNENAVNRRAWAVVIFIIISFIFHCITR